MSQENVEIMRGGLEHFQTTGALPCHLIRGGVPSPRDRCLTVTPDREAGRPDRDAVRPPHPVAERPAHRTPPTRPHKIAFLGLLHCDCGRRSKASFCGPA